MLMLHLLKKNILLVTAVLVLVTVFSVVKTMSVESDKATNQQPTKALDTEELLSQGAKQQELDRIVADFKSHTGPEAYALFKKRNDPMPHGVQHEYAHLFGQKLYETVGIPGVAICDADFAFGCYHSFFGRALMENGTDIIFELEEACIEAHGAKGLGCQHGIGHGVLAELGPKELNNALEICIQLAWKGPLGGCMSGVFMEYNFNTINNDKPRPYNAEDPFAPCTDLDKKFSQSCHFELPQWWASAYRMGYTEDSVDTEKIYTQIAENCSLVPDTENKISCYRGLGNHIAGTFEYTAEEIKNNCALGKQEEGRTHCLEAAAWLLSWEPKYKDSWEELCSDLTGESQRICLSGKEMI